MGFTISGHQEHSVRLDFTITTGWVGRVNFATQYQMRHCGEVSSCLQAAVRSRFRLAALPLKLLRVCFVMGLVLLMMLSVVAVVVSIIAAVALRRNPVRQG